MASFAAEALDLIAGRKRDDLESDRALELQLTLLVLRVGEAARHVPPARQAAVDLPWRDIIAMRNRLVHAYFEVDHDLLWQEVHDTLPLVVRALRSAGRR
jgi:uncharacterized protein with HEPN domain